MAYEGSAKEKLGNVCQFFEIMKEIKISVNWLRVTSKRNIFRNFKDDPPLRGTSRKKRRNFHQFFKFQNSVNSVTSAILFNSSKFNNSVQNNTFN